LSYQRRLALLVLMDSTIVLMAIFLGRFLLSATFQVFTFPIIISSITLLLSHHFFSLYYKLYRKAWEYASIGELVIITKAVTFSIATAAIIQQIVLQDVYFRLLAVTWMLHMLLIGGSRLCWRILRRGYSKQSASIKRTLIVGAGSAGTMVARQLLTNHDAELLPVGFIDDDVHKHGLDIMGIPVIGGVADIVSISDRLQIENIVIAIPSLSKQGLNTIFQQCVKTKTHTQTIPMLEDLATGKISVSHLRNIQVDDLLGREPVELDVESISGYVTQKVVLVTGAGGSIGSEVCRQVAKFLPQKLILLGHGENSIYSIEMELKELYGEANIKFYTEIADLQDEEKMMKVMQFHRPEVVYHAAAHKHVPLMERNPEEAFKNNVLGTLNAAKAAIAGRVGTFVMISTDKAVNPTSVMGSTKRIAEMIIQHMDRMSSTKFVAVRFGNVLGSRGSVIPLFKKQIEKGGPVTVTHPDMVRYFMTIPEASRLVIQAGALARGGEIFVLDMGEPVKITDLAQNVIRMSGYTVEEIGIQFTGTRPGEKLFEEMLRDAEMSERQVYPKIFIGKSSEVRFEEIEWLIDAFRSMSTAELKVHLLQLANNEPLARRIVSVTG